MVIECTAWADVQSLKLLIYISKSIGYSDIGKISVITFS